MQNINSVPAAPIINLEPKKAETEQQQVSFQGTQHQVTPTEEKKTHPILKLITAGVVAVIAGAGHKTYSVNKVLKEANLKEASKISMSDIFLRNLNPVNWFSKAEAAKSLTDIECTKIGESGKLFKTKEGDTLLLDRSRVFKVKDGEAEDVEEFVKKAKPTAKTEGKIPAHINAQLIKDIQALPQDVNEENLKKLSHLILRDMGFNPDELQMTVRRANKKELLGGEARFDMKTGEILLNEENFLPSSLYDINHIAPLVRHELDHFEKMAKTYKQIGAKGYQDFLGSVSILPKGNVNEDFWNRATKDLNIDGFDHTPYTKGLQSQDEISPYVTSQYHHAKILSTYINNPFEKTAHSIQHDFESALEVQPFLITAEPIAEAFSKIETVLDSSIKKAKLSPDSKPVLYDYFFQEAQKTAVSGDDAITRQANVMKNMVAPIESTPITPEIIHAAYKHIIEMQAQAIKITPNENIRTELLKTLNQNLDSFLGEKHLISPEKELELLARKIHVANGGALRSKDIEENFEQTITIPQEIRERIFQNSEFQSRVAKEANEDFEPLEKTQSYILRSLLWKTITF